MGVYFRCLFRTAVRYGMLLLANLSVLQNVCLYMDCLILLFSLFLGLCMNQLEWLGCFADFSPNFRQIVSLLLASVSILSCRLAVFAVE